MKETAVISCGIKSICSKMLHLFLVPLLPQHREVCIRFVVGRMGLGGGTRGKIENSVAMKMLREMTTAMVSVITESILTGSTKTHSNVGITPMVTMWMKTKISISIVQLAGDTCVRFCGRCFCNSNIGHLSPPAAPEWGKQRPSEVPLRLQGLQ